MVTDIMVGMAVAGTTTVGSEVGAIRIVIAEQRTRPPSAWHCLRLRQSRGMSDFCSTLQQPDFVRAPRRGNNCNAVRKRNKLSSRKRLMQPGNPTTPRHLSRIRR